MTMEDLMASSESNLEATDLRCPECRQPLKKRRARKTDACEMVCGGCGKIFDVCDLDTVENLRKGPQ